VLTRWPVVWAALAYAAVGTVALWPSIRPGRTLVAADDLAIVAPYSALPQSHDPHNLQLSDVPFQFFPWFSFMADGLRHGQIRQWNPTLLGGVPVTPNGNVSPYYPPSWLGAVLAPFDAYDVFVLGHLVIGALGVYLLARALGARPPPAWIAGLLAFTAAFWVHWSTHVLHLAGMVWVPWVLAATWWLLAAPTRRRAAALAAVVGLWLLGGSPQYVYYGGLALLGWTVVLLVGRRLRARTPLIRPGLAFAGAMVLGALLAAPVLLPTAGVAGRVARGREPGPPTAHLPRHEAIRALVPDATGNSADSVFRGSNDELRMDSPFVGVTAVILAGTALGGLRTGGWGRLTLVLGLAAVLVLALTGFPHRILFDVLPGYDRFRSSPRWLFLLPAFALPLAALGLQDLLVGARWARPALAATAVLSVTGVAAWFFHARAEAGAPVTYFAHRALVAGAVALAVAGAGWLARSRPGLALAVVAAVALGEVGFHTPRWYPSVAQRQGYPQVMVADVARRRGGRVVHVGDRTTFPPFAPDVPMVYGVADAQGLSVLFPRDYDRFLRLIDDYGAYAQELNAAPPLSRGDLLSSPLLDVLDVRTVVAGRDVAVPAQYRMLTDPTADPAVYERASPGGAMVVASAAPASVAEMWQQVASPGWEPAARAAVAGLAGPVTGAGGTAAALPAPPDTERWQVDAPAGGFLRVGANWDGGWSARIDGKPARVLRADGVFRGVVVPAGRHVVRFAYRNPDESRGRVAALGALVVLAGLLAPRRQSRRARPEAAGTADDRGIE
jgi:hypothetical protein